ncbi:FecR family protein [Chitinophaga skermanii]|nr:FecR family protein [Chitinophaga skermanii]
MDNDCSPSEVDELLLWLTTGDAEPQVADMIMEELDAPLPNNELDEATKLRLEARLNAILGHAPSKVSRIRPVYWRLAAAAVITLLISVGLLYYNSSNPSSSPTITTAENDVQAGSTGAILTLSNQQQIVLDSAGNGVITSQNGSVVSMNSGQLLYTPVDAQAGEVVYNTITTPKGKQFSLVLPDGTKVWLNAASRITYPTSFQKTYRQVDVSGEVYFEVAQNSQQPFKVQSSDGLIEVLGTAFNVNTFKDDGIMRTTLVNGAVKVSTATKESIVLKPGQQAAINRSNIRLVEQVNIDKVVAWKNGYFNFNGLSLPEAMQQLARWYDIEVVYEKGIPNIQFYGEISRDVSLKGLLQGLEGAGVHFRIENGKKLIVYP